LAASHCAFRADFAIGGPSGGTWGRGSFHGPADGAGGGARVGGSGMRLMSKREERALREAAGRAGDGSGSWEEPASGGLFHGWEGEEDCGYGRKEEARASRPGARVRPDCHSESVGEQSCTGQGLWGTATDAGMGWVRCADSMHGGGLELGGGRYALDAEHSSAAWRCAVAGCAVAAGTSGVTHGETCSSVVGQWPGHDEGEEGQAAEELAAYLRPSAASPPGGTVASTTADSAPLLYPQSTPWARGCGHGRMRPAVKLVEEDDLPMKLIPSALSPDLAHCSSRAISASPRPALRPGSPDPPAWPCAACTFVNAGPMRLCEMCDTPRAGEQVVAPGGPAGCAFVPPVESDATCRGARGTATAGGRGGPRASGKRAALSPAGGGTTASTAKRCAGHGAVSATPVGRSTGAGTGGARPAARAGAGGAPRQATLQQFLGLKGEM
jgi:hypothetical protein